MSHFTFEPVTGSENKRNEKRIFVVITVRCVGAWRTIEIYHLTLMLRLEHDYTCCGSGLT